MGRNAKAFQENFSVAQAEVKGTTYWKTSVANRVQEIEEENGPRNLEARAGIVLLFIFDGNVKPISICCCVPILWMV